MAIDDEQYLRSVREQYENYPYPKRNPEDEKRTIYVTHTDFLGKISHFCYRAKKDLRKGGRFLVAGGGTGDAAIYLAEQLRGTDSEVVYLDLSQASMEIAKERAKTRGLNNITWRHNSLLELPRMDIGKFDYINCCGVLHHLEDPAEGLNALKSVLKENGCMGIMVYARYGRTGIYHVQELMRLVNVGVKNMQQQVDNTRVILGSLPKTNWYKRDEDRWIKEITEAGDIAIYDLFLHSKDRAYTVQEVYEWLESSGLNLIAFTGFSGDALRYDPLSCVDNPVLRERIRNLTVKEQQAIAELLIGSIKTHIFYTSAQGNTIADPNDLNNVPYYTFKFMTGEALYMGLKKHNSAPLNMRWGPNGEAVVVPQRRYTRYIFRYLDGMRCLAEIFDCIREDGDVKGVANPDNAELLEDFHNLYREFNNVELMLLRHKDIRPYKTTEELCK